ncbi:MULTISPECIES: M23 family metallopeptidase [unclassified Exiguobacterium]|uniref:murein hydrolase activator EnvC family protein n=1 Tax=unclassified Exiguobacterium TaxID=2644629 RepID=UPI000B58730E|nr:MULTISPECIES: M23 family metallopeptidase [unclassified Exiguobacterium]ASI34521.1 peptidase M23 [Exiguobacterium sp. N4-1P]
MLKKLFSTVLLGTLLLTNTPITQAATIKEKKADNAAEQRKLEKSIKKQESKISKEQRQINAIDAAINENIFRVSEKNKQIRQLNERIEELEADIIHYEEMLKRQEELLGDRLRVLQENDGNSIKWEEVIFGSKDLGDLFSRVMAGKKIAEQDDKMISAYLETQKKLADAKATLVDKKEERVKEKEALLVQKKELKQQMKARSATLKKLRQGKTKFTTKLLNAKELQATLEAQERAIAAAKAAAKAAAEKAAAEKAAAEKAAEAAEKNNAGTSKKVVSATPVASVPSGSAQFVRPASGSVSQGFGPASGANGYTFHNGVDFRGSVGSSIVAAASGTVITAGSGGPYGNHVMISHFLNGKVYTTVYAHMNSLSVHAGQTVSQGQQIGTLGNTGNSTGAHLHFELHIGGYQYSATGPANTVNPLAYL